MFSNVIGYRACVKIELIVGGLIAYQDIQQAINLIQDLAHDSFKKVVMISEWCPGNRKLVMHAEYWEIQQFGISGLRMMEEELESIIDYICSSFEDRGVLGSIMKCASETMEYCPATIEEKFTKPCELDETISFDIELRNGPLMGSASDILRKTSFIPYMLTNKCAFVEISKEEFKEIDNKDENSLMVYIPSGKTLDQWKMNYVKNKTFVRVCLEDFIALINDSSSILLHDRVAKCEVLRRSIDTSFDIGTTAGLISLICTCISLLFLFFTLLTYIIFQKLRSGGGHNIMMLTVLLFVAQSLYEFAMEQYENKTLCSIFGVLIHFFWLAAIFSMNACTIERFIKLCFPLRSRSIFMTNTPLIVANAYIFSFPLLIIGINMIFNILTHNNIGYGNLRLCYINERYSRIFSFVVPMCIIVMVNTVLLVVTIIKLRRQAIPGAKKSSNTRIGLVACVRLSMVTGCTWLISLLYEALPYKVLEYVFTALLGLQGIVLFISIVINKRVVGMYRQLLSAKMGRLALSSNDTPSSQSKTNNIENEKRNLVKENKKQSVAKGIRSRNDIFKNSKTISGNDSTCSTDVSNSNSNSTPQHGDSHVE